MLGILIILIVSWGILTFFKVQKGLNILGYKPWMQKIKTLTFGFVMMIPILISIALLDTIVLDLSWSLKPNPNYQDILYSLKYHFISAATEELIFRGAIIVILMRYFGNLTGLTISSVAFGLYHLFSYGMIGGNIIPVLYVFTITGFMGVAFAWSYIKSGTLLLPIGMHLSWNFLSTLYKEHTPVGEILFYVSTETILEGWVSLFYSLLTGLIPSLLIILLVNKYYQKTLLIVISRDEVNH